MVYTLDDSGDVIRQSTAHDNLTIVVIYLSIVIPYTIAMRKYLLPAFLLLSACQSQVPLMSTPEALRNPDLNLFELNPAPLATNVISTLYATTRTPSEGGPAQFTARKDSEIHFGIANMMVGGDDVKLSDVIEQSTTTDRTEKFLLSIVDAPIFGSVPLAEPGTQLDMSPELRRAIDRLNAIIAAKPTQELTIFVHGASNSFYVGLARGSMFQWFSGDNALALTFAWPSPGHIFGYLTDKRVSTESAVDLAQFIEFLARYTVATRINVLAYSAGGRTVGGALAQLGQRHKDPDVLRLGHVYFAQSDQPMAEFFSDLPLYFDLLEGMTVTAAPGDSVLRIASMTDGQTRIGAVSEKSGERLDLSPDIADRLTEILSSERMVIIDLTDVPAAEYRLTHGAWYESPWVSADVMLTLLGGLTVKERGLVSVEVTGATVWRFPPDYLERLDAGISQWRREQDRRNQAERAEDSG